MRITLLQEKRTLTIKDREIWIAGEGYHVMHRDQPSLAHLNWWSKEPVLLRTAMRRVMQPPHNPTGVELLVNGKFILDAEEGEITDEIDGLIIARFDELRLNFGEPVKIKLVGLCR